MGSWERVDVERQVGADLRPVEASIGAFQEHLTT